MKKAIIYTNGAIGYCFCYPYDNHGREVLVDFCHADGTTYGYDELIYDENGKQSGFYWYDQDGNLDRYTEY